MSVKERMAGARPNRGHWMSPQDGLRARGEVLQKLVSDRRTYLQKMGVKK